jgi:hypothetical protein
MVDGHDDRHRPTWATLDLSFGIETQRQTVPAMGIQEFVNKNLVHVAPIDARA